MVDNSWGMVHWGSMVDKGSVVDRGMVGKGGGVVDGSVGHGLVGIGRDGGDVAGFVLFLVVVLVDLAGLGRGLAVDSGGVGTVGLGDGGGHGGGIAELDGLVVHLVSGGQSQNGEDSDESLQDKTRGLCSVSDHYLRWDAPCGPHFAHLTWHSLSR